MKIVCLSHSPASPSAPEIFTVPDSSWLKDSRPFFIPFLGHEYGISISAAVRIGKVGKRISPKFAGRYCEAFACAVNFIDLTALAAGSGNSVARGFDCAVATSPFSFPEPPDFSLRIDGETILEWNAAGNPAILHDAIAEASTHFTLKTGDIILYSLSPTAGNIRRDTKVSFIDSLDNEITSFNIK